MSATFFWQPFYKISEKEGQVTQTLSIVLNAHTDPFLRDHLFERGGQRSALLPGVSFMQVAAKKALENHPGLALTGFEGTEFLRTLFVPENSMRVVSLELTPQRARGSEGLIYDAELKGTEEGARTYARTRLTLGPERRLTPHPRQRIPSGARQFWGDQIYRPGNYPNRGVMAVLGGMTVYGDSYATLHFAPAVLDLPGGREAASLEALPLQIDLGFEGTGFLEMLRSYPDPSCILGGIQVPSRVANVSYGRRPGAEDLPDLGVHLVVSKGAGFDFVVANLMSGEIFAEVTGFQTALWNPWRDGLPPTLAQFFGQTT